MVGIFKDSIKNNKIFWPINMECWGKKTLNLKMSVSIWEVGIAKLTENLWNNKQLYSWNPWWSQERINDNGFFEIGVIDKWVIKNTKGNQLALSNLWLYSTSWTPTIIICGRGNYLHLNIYEDII